MKRTHKSSKSAGKESNESSSRDGIGSRQALDSLIHDYGERAFQFAYRLSKNAEEAKELVQEALYRMARSWDRYDQSRPPEAWFFVILRNAFLDSRKLSAYRHAVSLDAPLAGDVEDGCIGDQIPDGRADILEQLARQETSRAVTSVLRGLRKEHCSVLTLRDIKGLSYEAIAQTLGVSIGTIRSRISRARESFRINSGQLPGLVS